MPALAQDGRLLGVTLGRNLGITPSKERKASGFSRDVVKRLAGG